MNPPQSMDYYMNDCMIRLRVRVTDSDIDLVNILIYDTDFAFNADDIDWFMVLIKFKGSTLLLSK